MNCRTAVGMCLILLTFPVCRPAEEPEAYVKPNIIYILADDLGYGDLGCYGQKVIETPHIDALAANGIRFTQHYSGSPVCAPSRCVLLTGKHSGHAYIRGNDEWGERGDVWDYAKAVEDPNLEGQRPIPANTVTVGRLLQQAGYKTAIVGKWGLGGPLTDGIPNRQGFDFFFGYNCQRQAHTYYPKHLWKNTEKVWLDNDLVVPRTGLDEGVDPRDSASYAKYTLSEYAPELMLEEALNFIDRNKSNPFFLYFASPIPHVPLQAPHEWVEKYVAILGDEEPYLGDRGYFPHRNPRAAYAGMVSYLDYQVGELVKKLESLGLSDNTLIMFSSDNGPTYNGGTDSPFFDSGGPFKSERGWGKGTLREGGIRVPMIAKWPGQVAPGTETEHLSAFYDLIPTLCDVASIETPEDADGISFLPTLLSQANQEAHEYLYWEFPSANGQQAVHMGKWKGFRQNILDANLTIELYDLSDELAEQKDVSKQYPEVVEKIRQIMEAEHQPAILEGFQIKPLGD